jgi:isopentenyl-diphosphate delta-isomerase
MIDEVILVDENDSEIGQMEKLEAHQKGLLHRAFSIFIFNYKGEILLQKRALSKYHSAGLWTNACCSHPRPNEAIEDAANRRLAEEMNLKLELKYLFKFTYKTEFENNLTEHEIDHVFIAHSNSEPVLNPNEAIDFKYISQSDLINDLIDNPSHYTSWFRICIHKVLEKAKNSQLK